MVKNFNEFEGFSITAKLVNFLLGMKSMDYLSKKL